MMLLIRYMFISITFILSTFTLLLTNAHAQGTSSYRFLEVVDISGKPVVGAKVEQLGTGTKDNLQTNKKGIVPKVTVYLGDNCTTGIKVSKSGYVTTIIKFFYYDSHYTTKETSETLKSSYVIYEDLGVIEDYKRRQKYYYLLQGEVPQYSEFLPIPIKIQLLKLPVTAEEQKNFEVEQKNHELIPAVIKRDIVTVQTLLQAGANPNTIYVNKIPAILWATVNLDVEMVKRLLTAGADVRDKNKSGRKALLYYLQTLYQSNYAEPRAKQTPSIELVETFIKAGVDVNVADREGKTALTFAKQVGNEEIIKLLESAGAR